MRFTIAISVAAGVRSRTLASRSSRSSRTRRRVISDQLSSPVCATRARRQQKTTVIAGTIILFGTRRPACSPTALRARLRRDRFELPLVPPRPLRASGLLAAFGRSASVRASALRFRCPSRRLPLPSRSRTSRARCSSGRRSRRSGDRPTSPPRRTLTRPGRSFRVVLPLARDSPPGSRSRSRGGLASSGRRSCSRPAEGDATLPLAIYAEFDQNFDTALAVSGVLVVISILLLAGLRLGLEWQRSSSTSSTSLFGLSGSS